MNAVRILSRKSFSQWRCFSKCPVSHQSAAAELATPSEALRIPTPEGLDKIYSQKLEKIATDISNLNLLEVSELSQLLKRRLNLPDQPMMAMGSFSAQSAKSADDEEDAPVAAKVKTEYTVKMTGFDDKQKVAVIKEIKNLLEGFNLVQAKKLVESIPTVIKADISKEEAEKLKEALTKAGAVIELE